MRHVKVLGLCLVAVFALAAMTASAASAKTKDVLQFNEGEAAAAPTAPGNFVMEIATCIVQSEGHLTGNDAATVTLSATKGENLGCNEAYSESGSITSASLSAKGKLALTGTIDVTYKGTGCTYAFSKWKAKMPVGGGELAAASEVPVSGKKVAGPGSCAKKLTETVEVMGFTFAVGPEETEAFNTTLVP